ncbi:MAG: hypothetical protein KAG53_00625 [Endozoicomonadaceae bacterium]|nr:hypothetical protein [Endozoicomonadaceae bacterium]
MNDYTIKQIALMIAASCLEKSIVDELNGKGTITDEQKMAFNKQVSDGIYTFLLYMLNKPPQEYSALLEELAKKYPEDWPLPEIDTRVASLTAQLPYTGSP